MSRALEVLTLPLPFLFSCPAAEGAQLCFLTCLAGGWMEGPNKLSSASQVCEPPAPVHSTRMWTEHLQPHLPISVSVSLYLPFSRLKTSPFVCSQCLSQPTDCARSHWFSCCNTACDIITLSVSNSIKTRCGSVSDLTLSAAAWFLGVWLAGETQGRQIIAYYQTSWISNCQTPFLCFTFKNHLCCTLKLKPSLCDRFQNQRVPCALR